jgi:hypothetical protein
VRLRLLVPGRRRRAGLGGLAAAAAALALLAGCGGGSKAPASTTAAEAPPAPPTVLATGLTEANAQLLWPAGVARPDDAPVFGPWRDRVAALRPAFVRVAVDWARLQPDPAQPAVLDGAADGCLRGVPPCGAFSGLREQLQAIAAMQRAGHGAPEVEMVVLGVPDWAAEPASGCERSDAAPRSRPITAAGLVAYRALLGQLVALGQATGAQLRWWSPFNEPNHAAFISPQRATCSAAAPSRAPEVYAQLVRAAHDALDAAPGDQRLVLGEMAGVTTPTPRGSSVQEVVAGLPDDVACASRMWSQHEYAILAPQPTDGDPVAALEQALDARPCTRGAHIWITETGVGGPRPGADRATDDASLRAGCRAMDVLLRRWAADPRVDVAIQYTFRDDTAYPVGLADPGLTRTYPAYDLWRAWGARAPSDPPPALPASCR